jgi:hypothetical protein
MGRKGVSKRKTGKTKSIPVVSDKANGSVTSVLRAVDSQPAKTFDTAKSAIKPTSDSKKKNKKG